MECGAKCFDVKRISFLHNHTMVAVAQQKYVYIYDQNGIELHCLRRQLEVESLHFLPYHFLLTSIVSDLSQRIFPSCAKFASRENKVFYAIKIHQLVLLWPNIVHVSGRVVSLLVIQEMGYFTSVTTREVLLFGHPT